MAVFSKAQAGQENWGNTISTSPIQDMNSFRKQFRLVLQSNLCFTSVFPTRMASPDDHFFITDPNCKTEGY